MYPEGLEGNRIMAYVKADYLSEIIGDVTELEVVDYIVYSPKLDKTIILSQEIYNALNKQSLEACESEKVVSQEALRVLEEFLANWEKKKDIENDE